MLIQCSITNNVILILVLLKLLMKLQWFCDLMMVTNIVTVVRL